MTLDFNQYYKTSKKLELRKYARKVPNLYRTYYNYSLGLDNGEFDNIDSLKDFLIKKNLKSKKIDEDETLVDLIEDYFVRTHIMKINSKYYIDYYDVIPSGDQYRRALEL